MIYIFDIHIFVYKYIYLYPQFQKSPCSADSIVSSDWHGLVHLNRGIEAADAEIQLVESKKNAESTIKNA
jgi:hypothetical protein